MLNGIKQNIKKENGSYFMTLTVVDWIDIFTREVYKKTVIETLRYCIKNKGLNVYAYCIMSNHIHMIVNCDEQYNLSEVIRDFKKFTSRKILFQIQNDPESRREWLLKLFKEAAEKHAKTKNYKFWKDGNHAIELYNSRFTWNKVKYIHNNPVKAGLVKRIEDWKYSSASNYIGEASVLQEVHCLAAPVETIF